MSGPFNPSARIYDVTYAHMDYAEHAAAIEQAIRERCPSARSFLDVACGTGKHLEILRNRFEHVEGLDVDPAMLAVARERLPDVVLHQADMVGFDLGRRFDAVTCLFSSIGYVQTLDALRAAVATMAAHLEPGGVLVVEPWLWPSMVEEPHRIRVQVTETPDLVVARTSRWLNADTALSEGISRMEFAYLVTEPDGSEMLTEWHDMGLFTPEQYVAAFEAAGLDAAFDRAGTRLARGLAIGVARP
jgi:SAM-dependent methyltransferase